MLVVDDSAVVRAAMTAILSQCPDMRVVVAADPLIAMEKMKRVRPDVIVLDLEMPRMHGLVFLKQVMKEDPVPVVVCSAMTAKGTDMHRLQELVRLHRLGTTARHVARLLGLSPNTERRYREALEGAGLLQGEVDADPDLEVLTAAV